MAFKRKLEQNKTKMVSLIDIVFLLLIFFLITTVVTQKGKEAEKKLIVTTPTIEIGKTQVLIQLFYEREIEGCWEENPIINEETIKCLWLSHSERVRNVFEDIEHAEVFLEADYKQLVKRQFSRRIAHFEFNGLRNHIKNFADANKGKKIYVTIRVPATMEYIKAIKVASLLSTNGITDFGFVGGTVDQLMRGTFDIQVDEEGDKYYTIRI